MQRLALIPITAALVAGLTGCGGEREADHHREAELRRLDRELTESQQAQAQAEREREALADENARLLAEARANAATINTTASHPATHSAEPAPTLPELPPVADNASPSGAAGAYVVVLASVGKGHVDQARGQFEQVATELARRHADLPASFGLRTPRSGGLQLVYGAESGLARASANAALAVLRDQYADAWVLNTQ